MALHPKYTDYLYEVGIDEAGRGCLAGPVVAAAIILPPDFTHPSINDSKKLSHKQRMELRPAIMEAALCWNLGMISAPRIDIINIQQATYEAMHEAVAGLGIEPEFLTIDGNRFLEYRKVPHACIIKGDSKFLNIAAASILAKTYRDEIMDLLHEEFPEYGWNTNRGYPTVSHRKAIQLYGSTHYHRKTFNWKVSEETV